MIVNQCNKLIMVSNIFYSYIARESISTDIFNSEKSGEQTHQTTQPKFRAARPYIKHEEHKALVIKC